MKKSLNNNIKNNKLDNDFTNTYSQTRLLKDYNSKQLLDTIDINNSLVDLLEGFHLFFQKLNKPQIKKYLSVFLIFLSLVGSNGLDNKTLASVKSNINSNEGYCFVRSYKAFPFSKVFKKNINENDKLVDIFDKETLSKLFGKENDLDKKQIKLIKKHIVDEIYRYYGVINLDSKDKLFILENSSIYIVPFDDEEFDINSQKNITRLENAQKYSYVLSDEHISEINAVLDIDENNTNGQLKKSETNLLTEYRLNKKEKQQFLNYQEKIKEVYSILDYAKSTGVQSPKSLDFLRRILDKILSINIDNNYLYNDLAVLSYEQFIGHIETINAILYPNSRSENDLFTKQNYLDLIDYIFSETDSYNINFNKNTDLNDLGELEQKVYSLIKDNGNDDKKRVLKYLENLLDLDSYEYVQKSDIYSIVFWESYYNDKALSQTGASGLFQLTGPAIRHFYERKDLSVMSESVFIENAKKHIGLNVNVGKGYLDILESLDIHPEVDKSLFESLSSDIDNIYGVLSNMASSKGVSIDKSDLEDLLNKLNNNNSNLVKMYNIFWRYNGDSNIYTERGEIYSHRNYLALLNLITSRYIFSK